MSEGTAVEHIPAIHAAKVGMRCPARVMGFQSLGVLVDLDLTTVAPGRSPILRASLDYQFTLAPEVVRELSVGQRIEVVVTQVFTEAPVVIVSLPADPTWLTWNNETVRRLARRIRKTQELVLLPVLADALEEAGCTDVVLLEHCRQPPDDARSWVVELLATQE